MFCTNCGSQQREDARFCSSCGTPLHRLDEQNLVVTTSTHDTSASNDLQSVSNTPSSPEHGLAWSLFLTPIAGSIFWSKNWNRLGKPQHIWWTWVTGIFTLLSFPMFGAATGRLIYLVWTFTLYFIQRKMIPQTKKSMPDMIFSSILAVLIFVSIFFSSNHTDSTTSAPDSTPYVSTSPTTTSAPPSIPTTTEPASITLNTDGGTYKGVEVSNVGIALFGVNATGSIGNQYYSKKADGKFVIINVLVKNNQNDAVTLSSNEFKIIDNQGREFTDSSDGTIAYATTNNSEKGLFLNQLNPGVTTKGFVVFDVPSDLDISTSTLEVQGGFTGDKAQIPLAVQKK